MTKIKKGHFSLPNEASLSPRSANRAQIFGARNALSSVFVVVVVVVVVRKIFMVQLVKSRISSCKTTCSWRRARRGHRRLRGGGRDLTGPRGIAPRRRPSVIHFTALSILILRNSFGERASDGRSRSSVNGCHTWRGRGEPRAEPRGARECGALSCPRWPDAIRPFPYPPPLQSFSPLRRKERRLPSVRPSVLFCMP